MTRKDVKRGVAVDQVFINEMSLELVNGGLEFIDYEPSQQQVASIIKRFERQKEAVLYAAEHEG